MTTARRNPPMPATQMRAAIADLAPDAITQLALDLAADVLDAWQEARRNDEIRARDIPQRLWNALNALEKGPLTESHP
jgi:hypothetical protein